MDRVYRDMVIISHVDRVYLDIAVLSNVYRDIVILSHLDRVYRDNVVISYYVYRVYRVALSHVVRVSIVIL